MDWRYFMDNVQIAHVLRERAQTIKATDPLRRPVFALDPIRVLVIDDNPEIATMMQRFTAETRYRVVGVRDPRQTIEQALALKPDVIVIDIMMPKVDGLQVLSRIKHHPVLARLPVIICSVLPQKDLAASMGASCFVQKPFQRDDLIMALKQVAPGETAVPPDPSPERERANLGL